MRLGSGSSCAIGTCACAPYLTDTAPYPLRSPSRYTPQVETEPTVCIGRGYGEDRQRLGRAGQSKKLPTGFHRADSYVSAIPPAGCSAIRRGLPVVVPPLPRTTTGYLLATLRVGQQRNLIVHKAAAIQKPLSGPAMRWRWSPSKTSFRCASSDLDLASAALS